MARPVAVGVALTVISAFAFGSGALFAKPVYGAGVDWFTLMTWRFTFGAALSWVWVTTRPRRRGAARALDRRAILVAVALGVLYTGNSSTYFAGLETVPASLAALIVYVYPAIVAVLALRFGRRLEGRRAWGALGLAMIGVVFAIGTIDAAHMPPPSGLLLMAASPLIYSVWIVLSARLAGERRSGVGSAEVGGADPIAAGAVMMTATATAFWLAGLALGRPILPAQVPAGAWGGIVGIGVVSTFIAIQAFYAGAHRIGAARASLVSTVEPIWTIVLAGILFGERLGPLQLVGGALILAGVVIAQTQPGAANASELRIADE
ncbi:MAG: DMT family transporter [Chloroflexi bacterium]|nr:DMT family transporter [Chloroflexota bacterium]